MMGMIEALAGIEIIETEIGTSEYVQYKFPRSKKKRIKKKWAKNPKNFRTNYLSWSINYGQILICHPLVAKSIRSFLNK